MKFYSEVVYEKLLFVLKLMKESYGETSSKEQRLNVDSFLTLVRKYTDITELTAEIIGTFVERIEVQQPEKVPGTRNRRLQSFGISSGQSISPKK